MIAHSLLLVEPTIEAGIRMPPNPEDFTVDEFPHWAVFTNFQLGRPLPDWETPWSNAKVIAAVPDDKIKLVTAAELRDLGCR